MNTRIRKVIAAGAGLAVVAAGATYWATSSSASTARFRTAEAATGSVSQTYVATGTISRDANVEATFSVDGTVKSVAVEVGDTVSAGDTIATLDSASLKLALLNAETDLAQAEATLYAAENPSSTTSSGSGGGGSGAGSGSAGGSGSAAGSGTGTGSTPSTGGISASDAAQLYEAIAAVNVASAAWSNDSEPTTCDQVYAALLAAQEDTDEADDSGSTDTGDTDPGSTDSGSGETSGGDSGSEGDQSGTDSGGSGTDSGEAGSADTGSDSGDATGSADSGEAEQLALTVDEVTIEDIKACGEARTALLTANAVLADYYNQLITTGTIVTDGESTDPGTETPETSTGGGSPSAGGGSSRSASSGSSSSTSEQAIAAAEADKLKAEQAVADAEADLENATLLAPIDGIVGELTLAEGDSASAGSAIIVGTGTATVSVEVPLATRTLLSQGMEATVVPAGSATQLDGKVASISILETSGTAGDSPTYTTTVSVSDPDQLLKAGAKAAVSVVVRSATDAVVVPASAVTPTGSGTATVQVVDSEAAESAQTVEVETGAVGSGRVEITSGLTLGQLVVLSDSTITLDTLTDDTSTSSATRAISGGGGGGGGPR